MRRSGRFVEVRIAFARSFHHADDSPSSRTDASSAADAKRAYEQTKTLIDARQGRFKGYVPSTATKVLALSSTHLGWDYRGHYLVYFVIARADGKDFAEGDPFAQQILYDIIEVHLLGTVVQKRAVVAVTPSGGSAPASVSAS